MLRNQSLFFKNDTPMIRVSLLAAALESVIWTYIKDNFYSIYGKTHGRGDIKEAIELIHESMSNDSKSYYATVKGCVVGFPRYHRLSDIVSLYEMTHSLHFYTDRIQKLDTEYNKVSNNNEFNVPEFVKIGMEYLREIWMFSKFINRTYDKLKWKTSHTFEETYVYEIYKTEDKRTWMSIMAAKHENLYLKFYRLGWISEPEYRSKRIYTSCFKETIMSELHFGAFPNEDCYYKEYGLLGPNGGSSLAGAINENIYTNPNIKLSELCETFERDMYTHILEIGLSFQRKRQLHKEVTIAHEHERLIVEQKAKALQKELNFKDQHISLVEDERRAALINVSEISDLLANKDNQLRKLHFDNMQLKNEIQHPPLRIRK